LALAATTFFETAFLAGTVPANADFFRSWPVGSVVVGAAAGEKAKVVVVTGSITGADVALSFEEPPVGAGGEMRKTPPTPRSTTRAEAAPTIVRDRFDGTGEPPVIHAHHCLTVSIEETPSLGTTSIDLAIPASGLPGPARAGQVVPCRYGRRHEH
jgi:hypothetical protein